MIVFTILILSLGIVGLYFGAKILIKNLEDIAYQLNISYIMVGLTILAVGTSLPEIAVSIIGGFDKLLGIDPNIDGIIIGNKIGSFLSQITLILGILAFSAPIFVSKWELRREIPMLFISALIFLFLAIDGYITQFDALLMIILYIIYLLLIIWSERRIARSNSKTRYAEKQELTPESFSIIETPLKKSSIKKDVLFSIIGMIILLFAAELTVLSAHDLAQELKVPENVIGILIVGVGTSLPELVADLTAIRRRSYGLAVGDILGSNICDILFATGSGAIIIDFKVAPVILVFDLPVLFIAIVFASYFLWTEKKLKKWEGGFLISFFIVYTLFKLLFFQKII